MFVCVGVVALTFSHIYEYIYHTLQLFIIQAQFWMIDAFAVAWQKHCQPTATRAIVKMQNDP